MVENLTTPAKKPNSGRFQVGNPGSPGRPKAGLQSFKDRLAHWLETKTIGDIQEIIENPKKWNKLLSVDAMVARRIADACGKSGGNDFVAILDRLLGKPALMAELNVTHGLADRLDKAEALLGSTVIDAEYNQVDPPMITQEQSSTLDSEALNQTTSSTIDP